MKSLPNAYPFLRASLVLGLLLSLGACAGTTRIERLLDDPSEFDGETVRIRGEVTRSFGVPVVGGAYGVDDGTGELTVVTRNGGTPREGADVSVEGIFRSVFNLGDRMLSVLEEREREVP